MVDCGNLASPQNGFVSITGTSEGSNAIYRCRRGFRLDGNRRRRCLNTGEWSGQEPFCRVIIGKFLIKMNYANLLIKLLIAEALMIPEMVLLILMTQLLVLQLHTDVMKGLF